MPHTRYDTLFDSVERVTHVWPRGTEIAELKVPSLASPGRRPARGLVFILHAREARAELRQLLLVHLPRNPDAVKAGEKCRTHWLLENNRVLQTS